MGSIFRLSPVSHSLFMTGCVAAKCNSRRQNKSAPQQRKEPLVGMRRDDADSQT
jgi:hypothetical protein